MPPEATTSSEGEAFLTTDSVTEFTKQALFNANQEGSEETLSLQIEDPQKSNNADDEVKVPLGKTQFSLVMLGLVLAMLMGSLDQTIVSTTLKNVVADFGHQELVPWIGSSYLLTCAPFGVLYGKLAEMFGRKGVFVGAMIIFEVGSLICGIAQSMSMLVVGRAIAGVGGGGIFSMVIIIISDIVSIRDRGKYQGMVFAVFGASSVLGPLIGGALSDHASWRWCYLINLPLGFVTIATVVAFLRFPVTEGRFWDKVMRIDFSGILFLFGAVTCFVTPLQLGGSVWSWSSPQVIVLFILGSVLTGIFCYNETKVAEPIIPASLFCNVSVSAVLVTALALGCHFMATMYYITLFYQVVNGDTATSAGVKVIPLVFGFSGMSIIVGFLISKFGKYRIFILMAPPILIVSSVLISTLDIHSSLAMKVCYLLLGGIGAGIMIQTRTIAIQASVQVHHIAQATAIAQTCMTLGGAFGISISGTVFNNYISGNVGNYATLSGAIANLTAQGVSVEPTDVLALSELLADRGWMNANGELISLFNCAFRVAYLSLLGYPIIIGIAALFVKEYPLPQKK
ncbi:major facilitator superfamily domain-containing protein [Chytriomyces sp. MP71]|nr:major facilitator superfamily domain-containing protein [Chytriomyces sp. MP71]